MAWAVSHGHIVFTNDLDFGALLALSQDGAPSVFQFRTLDLSPDALGARAVDMLNRFASELAAGALIVVDDLRERVRLLPLR